MSSENSNYITKYSIRRAQNIYILWSVGNNYTTSAHELLSLNVQKSCGILLIRLNCVVFSFRNWKPFRRIKLGFWRTFVDWSKLRCGAVQCGTLKLNLLEVGDFFKQSWGDGPVPAGFSQVQAGRPRMHGRPSPLLHSELVRVGRFELPFPGYEPRIPVRRRPHLFGSTLFLASNRTLRPS